MAWRYSRMIYAGNLSSMRGAEAGFSRWNWPTASEWKCSLWIWRSGLSRPTRTIRIPFVHFIQGSVLEPPLKQGVADFIYCAGVLVAIPNPKVGFRALRPVLKPGGRCFIWMYHPIDARHHPNDKVKMSIYNWLRVHVVSHLPIRIQHGLFLAALPFYVLKRDLRNLLRGQKTGLTWREKMQGLTDMFSPVYQHRFAEEEIVEWYRELGFLNVTVAYQEAYGFAVRGDTPSALREPQLTEALT